MKVKRVLINKKGSDVILRTFTPFYQKYISMEKFFLVTDGGFQPPT